MLKAKVNFKDGGSYTRRTKRANYTHAVCYVRPDGTTGTTYHTSKELAEKTRQSRLFKITDFGYKELYIAEVTYVD